MYICNIYRFCINRPPLYNSQVFEHLISLLNFTVLTCPQLTFDNGVIVVPVNSNLRVGTVAIYMCNEGLILEGIKNRTCQANGFWSGNEPVCRGKKTNSL